MGIAEPMGATLGSRISRFIFKSVQIRVCAWCPWGPRCVEFGTHYGAVITYLILSVKLGARELCPICLTLLDTTLKANAHRS